MDMLFGSFTSCGIFKRFQINETIQFSRKPYQYVILCPLHYFSKTFHDTRLLFDLSYKQIFLFIISTFCLSLRRVTLIWHQSIKLLFHAIISSFYVNTSCIFLFFYAISYLDNSSDRW